MVTCSVWYPWIPGVATSIFILETTILLLHKYLHEVEERDPHLLVIRFICER